MQRIQFDYFHGMEAEQYSFYRIPKMLFTAECFRGLSCEAKVLYGLMLDRMGLSIKNRWFDEEDRVYIVFTVEEIGEMMDCGTQKAVKLVKELDAEKGIGLIEKKRLGLGKPNVIYVKNFMVAKEEPPLPEKTETLDDADSIKKAENKGAGDHNPRIVKITNQECSEPQGENCENCHTGAAKAPKQEFPEPQGENNKNCPSGMEEAPKQKLTDSQWENSKNRNSGVVKTTIQEFPESQFKNGENHNSGMVKTTIQEFPKSQSNKTDINKTDFSETAPIHSYPSDVIRQMEGYRGLIRENISYRCFLRDKSCQKEELDELVELMVDVMMMPDYAVLRIAGVEKPVTMVKERFLKLDYSHIAYVLCCLRGNTGKVGNIRAYLLTSLYNAVLTIDNYYRAEANHDLYGAG